MCIKGTRQPILTDTVGRVLVDILANMLTEYRLTRGQESADTPVDTSADILMTCC